jgi:hypothetical protein
MKRLEDFQAEKVEINHIYGGLNNTKEPIIITGNNEDYIEEC